jgi:hypothetical protein
MSDKVTGQLPAQLRGAQSKVPVTETLEKVPPHGMKQEITAGSPLTAETLLWAAGVIVGMALLTSLCMQAWLWWRRRQNKVTPSGWTADPTAWERLLETIAAIELPKSSEIHEHNEQRQRRWNQFCSDVSICLRRALEIKTGQPFGERTTEEIRQWALRGLDLKGVMADMEFLEFLDLMDRVRFGGKTLTEAEAEGTLARLRDWVRRLEQDSSGSHAPAAHAESSSAVRLDRDERGGLRVFDT